MKVTQAEFARMAGVNRSTVHRWVANGRIEADAHGLIDPDSARAMRDATESPMPHHQARKAQFDEARAAQNSAGAFSQAGEYPSATQAETTQRSATLAATEVQPDLDKEAERRELLEIAKRTKHARMLNEEATARDKELELRRKAGELVERAAVDGYAAEYATGTRVIVERFPERWTHEWAALGIPADKAAKLLEEMAVSTNHELSDMAGTLAERFHAGV